MRFRLSLVALTAVLAVGCGDIAGAFVVVQETNIPDDPPGCDDRPHHYSRTIVRECDQSMHTVLVCASEPLCDAQVDALVEPYTTCTEEGGYEAEIPDACR